MFWFLLFIVFVLFLTDYLLNWNERFEALKDVQGPKMAPVFGNMFDIIKTPEANFADTRKWANTYKDFFKLWVPPLGALNLYHPDDIEIILSNSKYNEKSTLYNLLRPWLQDGLLLSSGHKWFQRRKILTPAFHFNILRHFKHILNENSAKLVDILDQETDKPQSDIIPIVSKIALNSICETAMGTKLDGNGERVTDYKEAVYKLGKLIIYRSVRIWMHFQWLFRLTETYREQNRTLKVLRDFTMQVINDRKNYIQEAGIDWDKIQEYNAEFFKEKKRLAMLDLLLSAKGDGLIDVNGVQEEVDTFMFEGHDTTAMALTYALLLLANYPKEQEKVVSELESIFEQDNRPPTSADLSSMKYLECCIKETLRLYPPVHFVSRQISETVQLKNCIVPAGCMANIHIFDLHRRSDIYPDPLRFDPERFSLQNSKERHPFAYIPFSAGPRNCIGQKFAMQEMKIFLSAILRRFRLLPVTKETDVMFRSDLVLRPANPIYVKFVRRN